LVWRIERRDRGRRRVERMITMKRRTRR